MPVLSVMVTFQTAGLASWQVPASLTADLWVPASRTPGLPSVPEKHHEPHDHYGQDACPDWPESRVVPVEDEMVIRTWGLFVRVG